MEASYARSLRERDDEIVRLKEQVRRGAAWGPKCPAQNEEVGRRRLYEENVKLKRDVAQLQDELKNCWETSGRLSMSEEPTARVGAGLRLAGGAKAGAINDDASTLVTPTASASALVDIGEDGLAEAKVCGSLSTAQSATGSTPRTTQTSRVIQLQRQLKQKEDDAQSVEVMLRAQIATLEARCERLRKQQQAAFDDTAATEEHPQRLAENFLLACQDRQRLEAELRRAEELAATRFEQLRSERDQWRQEREVLLVDQQRREKSEEALRRQLASMQEERRQLRTKQDEEREAELLRRAEQLEAQVASQNREMARLRQNVAALEGERAEACKRLERCQSMQTLPVHKSPGRAERQEAPLRGRGRGGAGGGGGRGGGHPAVGLGRRGLGSPGNPGAGTIAGSVTLGGSKSNAGAPSHSPPSTHGGTTGTASTSSLQGSTSGSTLGGTAGIGAAGRVADGIGGIAGRSAAGCRGRSESASSYTSSSDESSTGSSSTATATRNGSLSSLQVGRTLLTKIPGVGWYYRLRINSASSGGLEGVGIGVSLSMTLTHAGLPDRSGCKPLSWIAYRGRTLANGRERHCEWRPEALRPGDEVAFLVNLEGVCSIYVNGEERCSFGETPVPVKSLPEVQLSPLVEAAPRDVTLLSGAMLPPSVGLQRSTLAAGSPDRENGATRGIGSSPSVTAQVAAQGGLSPANGTAVATAEGIALPPPPPSSPTRSSSAAQLRQSSSLSLLLQRSGGQGLASPPVPPLLALRSGAATAPAAQSAVAAAAMAAVRRVPQLALHALPVR